MTALLLLLAAVAAAAQAPLPEDSHWARFSRIPALARTANPGVVVRVGRVPDRRDVDHDYWFERQVLHLGRRRSVAWTDTRSCPAAGAVLARLAALAPRFTRLGEEDLVDVVADGAAYRVDAPIDGGNGTMRIETTSRGPVKVWVDAMLAALEPCWTGTRPRLGPPR